MGFIPSGEFGSQELKEWGSFEWDNSEATKTTCRDQIADVDATQGQRDLNEEE
ncbi:hypothetical protein HAX54_023339, partial [Datura stramonium]|nr:hypothetical protein [Datura stramonium]